MSSTCEPKHNAQLVCEKLALWYAAAGCNITSSTCMRNSSSGAVGSMSELRFSQMSLGMPVLPPLVLAFHIVATTSGSGSSESDGSGEKPAGSES